MLADRFSEFKCIGSRNTGQNHLVVLSRLGPSARGTKCCIVHAAFYCTVLSVDVFVLPDLTPRVTAMSGLGVYRCRTAEAIRQKLNKESCLHIQPVNNTRADCTVPQARHHRKLLMESDQQNV